MCWEGIQQDIPRRVKLRLLLYFPPLVLLFSALHLYSPRSLAELIVKLNKLGVRSGLFKVDTFWLRLNNVYLTGGDPESELQERVTFWFITTFKVPWTGCSLGLDSISGKKKLLSEFTTQFIQETQIFPQICWRPLYTNFCWNRGLYGLFHLLVAGNTALCVSKPIQSFKRLMTHRNNDKCMSSCKREHTHTKPTDVSRWNNKNTFELQKELK